MGMGVCCWFATCRAGLSRLAVGCCFWESEPAAVYEGWCPQELEAGAAGGELVSASESHSA
eukprot:1735916-Pyramimonas_sp.AAC.1